MATEIWHQFEADAPVTLIPVGGGRLEVYADGEKLLDRKAEGGVYPDMQRVRQLIKDIASRLKAMGD
jgi:predicted Rdx family selenoprotein